MVRRVHEAGWQIAAHSCGDAATDEILDALELAFGDEDGRQYRARIEHLVALRDDQIRRMRQLGVLPSIQLTWVDSNWAASLLRVFDDDSSSSWDAGAISRDAPVCTRSEAPTRRTARATRARSPRR